MSDKLKTEIDPDFVFSQSSLQDYFDCQRRFQLRYIENLTWPAVETEPVMENERHQQEGQLFHRMVHQFIIGVPAEKLSRTAKSPELARWWENFLRKETPLHGYAQYPELILVSPLGSHRLLAKFDLVTVHPGGKTIIYDWKTYHKRPRDERMVVRMQTIVYRSLLVQAGATLNKGSQFQPDQVEMVYWYAEFPTKPARFPYQISQFKRDWQMLSEIVTEIDRQQSFPLTDDVKKCAYCPYRSFCERGERAGDTDNLEFELENAITDFDIDFEQVAEIEF